MYWIYWILWVNCRRCSFDPMLADKINDLKKNMNLALMQHVICQVTSDQSYEINVFESKLQ